MTCTPRHPRLLLDLSTSLAWRGEHAIGIVRVQREIATRLLDDPELCVIPVIYHDDAFRALELEFARRLVAPVPASSEVPTSSEVPASSEAAASAPSRAIGHDAQPVHRKVARTFMQPVARLVRLITRGLISVVPRRSREEVRLTLIHARQALRQFAYRGVPVLSSLEAQNQTIVYPQSIIAIYPQTNIVVYPQSTDVLFLCGLGWDVIDWRSLSLLRLASGLRIISVVHDLVPIKFPEFVGPPSDYLYNYFLHLIDNCDKVFCVSKCTQADLEEFISDNGRSPIPTEVIYSGANLPAISDPTEITDLEIRERLRSGRFALAVGTFEIRKNYSLLIDLWDELLADPSFDLDLVIVGRPGWCADDVIARLEGLRDFGSRVLWFKRMSDAGLSWLYEHCHITVFPSLYEGWGLPVVEALQHGRIVIASNRGGIPEAGLGHATILDPDDRAGWRAAVIAASRAPRQVINVEPGRFPDWDSAVATVKRGVRDAMLTAAIA